MADKARAQPRTTVIMPQDRDALVLEKLATLEEAMQGLVPLLAKIVTHLETQAVKPTPPMATYADLYDVPDAGPPEGELVAARLQPCATPPPRRWTRLLRGAL